MVGGGGGGCLSRVVGLPGGEAEGGNDCRGSFGGLFLILSDVEKFDRLLLAVRTHLVRRALTACRGEGGERRGGKE